MNLIINADDYGLSDSVNKGIIATIKNGIISDTSAIVNTDNFTKSIKLALDNEISSMGIHLNLTFGKPILPKEKIPTIIDSRGFFFDKIEFIKRIDSINLEEVEKELTAQINKFLFSEIKLNHIDAHHNFYSFNQELFFIAASLAKKYNVPMRCPKNKFIDIADNLKIKHPDFTIDDFYDNNVSEDFLLNKLEILKKNKFNSIEIMTHPGYIDDELKKSSSYVQKRKEELDIFTSNKILKLHEQFKIISFTEL